VSASAPAESVRDRSLDQRRLAADSKKAAAFHARLVLIDETGLFLNPLVRRSWAKIGQPAVLDADGGHRHKVSVIGGVSVSPRAQRLGLYFATEPDGFYTADRVVEFLRELLKHLRGNVVVVWDRGSNHKGSVIRKFLARNRRLQLEFLPPWAPDLNPVESVWSWLKYVQLANFAPEGTEQLDDEIVERLIGLRFDPGLLRSLWARSELPLPEKTIQ
jgi:putative transposase